jgi:hypothetical protein
LDVHSEVLWFERRDALLRIEACPPRVLRLARAALGLTTGAAWRRIAAALEWFAWFIVGDLGSERVVFALCDWRTEDSLFQRVVSVEEAEARVTVLINVASDDDRFDWSNLVVPNGITAFAEVRVFEWPPDQRQRLLELFAVELRDALALIDGEYALSVAALRRAGWYGPYLDDLQRALVRLTRYEEAHAPRDQP